MQTPTIVKKTQDYLLVKIPLPRGNGGRLATDKQGDRNRMTAAEKRLWGIIQEGEREYREGKTVRARSIDEALKTHARKKD